MAAGPGMDPGRRGEGGRPWERGQAAGAAWTGATKGRAYGDGDQASGRDKAGSGAGAARNGLEEEANRVAQGSRRRRGGPCGDGSGGLMGTN